MTTSGRSNEDPPGHTTPFANLLRRTPFQRILHGWQGPVLPASTQSSDVRTSVVDRNIVPLQAELANVQPVTVETVSTVSSHLRVRPDPAPSGPSPSSYQAPSPIADDEDPLSAYSPYTRAVILAGGDQSIARSSYTLDTLEAAEDAAYDMSDGTLKEAMTPPHIIAPRAESSAAESPLTTSYVSDPSVESVPDVSFASPSSSCPLPPGLTLGASDLLVYAQTSSSTPPQAVIVQDSYEGVGHPYLRGYIGPDRSLQQSQKRFYVVKTGWNPGIFTSWAAAWVRTIDFKPHTGQGAEFASASTYAAAVRYLGWDPSHPPSPAGPFPPPPSVPFVRGPVARTAPSSLPAHVESSLRSTSLPADTVAEVVCRLEESYSSPVPSRPESGGHLTSSSVPRGTETSDGKLRREQKGFPEYPATAFTGALFDVFYEAVRNIVHMGHWLLSDGSVITSHTDTPDDDHDRQVSSHLHYHLVVSIQVHRNPVALGVLSELRATDDYGNGIKLLESLRAIAYPTTSSSFLHDFDTWSRLSHQNKEDLTTFYRRAKEARHRLSTHSYTMSDFQFRTHLYYLVIKGPYGHAMGTIEEEIKCGRIDLETISTQDLFMMLHQEFREQCYKSHSTMEVVEGKVSGSGRAKGRRVQEAAPDGFTPVGATLSPDDARQNHKEFKCLLCKIYRKGNRKQSPGIHSTAKCPILKECGFTIQYDYEKDRVLNPEGKPSSFPNSGGRGRRADAGASRSSAGGGSFVVSVLPSYFLRGSPCVRNTSSRQSQPYVRQ